MAVTITTKFYDGSEWKDLSKVVFTSPNMDSPNTAGTRSHIFPGGAIPLGMWYEDLSNMYRVEDEQEIDNSTYFGYSAQLYEAFDLDNPGLYITISGTEQDDWIEYIRKEVSYGPGSWPMQYEQIVESNYDYLSFAGCTFSGTTSSGAYTYDKVIESGGWRADGDVPQSVEIIFPSSYIIDNIEFKQSGGGHGVDAFNFQAKLNPGDGYTTLLSDNKANDQDVEIYDISNMTSYKHFKLNVTSTHGGGIPGVASFNMKGRSSYTTIYTASSGTAAAAINSAGWYADEVGIDPHWVLFEYPSPERVTRVSFQNYSDYDVKDFKIQACTTSSGVFTDLYSGRAVVNDDYKTPTQNFVFSNLNDYKFYKLYFYSRYAASDGYGIKNCKLYGFEVDESITTPITLYFDLDNTVDVSHANNALTTDYLFKLDVDSVTGSGIMPAGTSVYGWGWPGWRHEEYAMLNLQAEIVQGEVYILVDHRGDISAGDTIYLFDTLVDTHTEYRTVDAVQTNPTEAYDLITAQSIFGRAHPIATTEVTFTSPSVDAEVTTSNSVVFELTNGECYDCRLTAWDDVTHSTTSNEIIAGDHCRVSALVFNSTGTVLSPTDNSGESFIYPPVLNRIFKGNTVYAGTNYYYGDFNMQYRTGAVLGDYLIFKPMLYGIHAGISYGVHDFLITLHYSYT